MDNDKLHSMIRALAFPAALTWMVLAPAGAAAQQGGKDPVAGTWMVVSLVTTKADGTKVDGYGTNPKGMLIFDGRGHYSLQICRAGRAKFASGARDKGTPQEYQAAVHDCNPHWGRYAIAGDKLVFDIEDAMYPNWSGLKQERAFKIEGDQLRYFVPAGSTGGTAELVWRRVK